MDYRLRAAECEHEWRLSNLHWLEHAGTARVAFCDSPFGPAVLKISTEPDMIGAEHTALRHFGRHLCPEVYGFSDDLQALLMERVGDGGDLTSCFPDPAVEVHAFLGLYQRMPGGMAPGYPTLEQWTGVFERSRQKTILRDQLAVLEVADRYKGVLFENCEHRVLHGDMHHYNILPQGSEWKLIDPHGVTGNPLYELGAFLRNPLTLPGHPQRRGIAKERVRLLAERLSESPETVALFGFYGVAIGMAWDIEQDEECGSAAELANIYLDLAQI